ncbi:Leucine-rich repeat domain-containing protein [Candidatus Bealeia paramacronuclearis]|uniref:Leucine-rich repeat domain-containing protein n=1 Tax=Candidatus Bealeia paramacronuclearis TaxID=1921001 RepID=A0ABZ2C3H0_9PROT|nr:Leucine-rich repeat domain-containing protein [Candidatus Bealeia paramacronuclearis]
MKSYNFNLSVFLTTCSLFSLTLLPAYGINGGKEEELEFEEKTTIAPHKNYEQNNKFREKFINECLRKLNHENIQTFLSELSNMNEKEKIKRMDDLQEVIECELEREENKGKFSIKEILDAINSQQLKEVKKQKQASKISQSSNEIIDLNTSQNKNLNNISKDGSKFNWEGLPNEIKEYIMSFIRDLNHRSKVGLVSLTWYKKWWFPYVTQDEQFKNIYRKLTCDDEYNNKNIEYNSEKEEKFKLSLARTILSIIKNTEEKNKNEKISFLSNDFRTRKFFTINHMKDREEDSFQTWTRYLNKAATGTSVYGDILQFVYADTTLDCDIGYLQVCDDPDSSWYGKTLITRLDPDDVKSEHYAASSEVLELYFKNNPYVSNLFLNFQIPLIEEGLSTVFDVLESSKIKRLKLNLSYLAAKKEFDVIKYIAQRLKEIPSLKKLEFVYTTGEDSDLKNLADLMISSLDEVNFEFANDVFRNEDAKDFGFLLKNNMSPKKVNLSGCELKPFGLQPIAEGLAYNTTLEKLSIGANCFATDIHKIFANSLKTNKTLKGLDLSVTSNFSDTEAKMFADALTKNRTLERLNLAWCAMTEKGLLFFAEMLKINKSLKILNLSMQGTLNGSIFSPTPYPPEIIKSFREIVESRPELVVILGGPNDKIHIQSTTQKQNYKKE